MKNYIIIIILLFQLKSLSQQLIIEKPVKFLALGDSYTIGQSVSKQGSWPYQFVSGLKSNGFRVDTISVIATTGWTTSNLKSAISLANPKGKFNLVSLLIGVNNQYQGIDMNLYIKEFEELIITAIELAGDISHVFVLSIPDYGFTPFGKSNQTNISSGINSYNSINLSITNKYGIKYFNITDISRQGLNQPSLLASDGLHPSAEMYRLWVELILKSMNLGNGVSNVNKNADYTPLKIVIDPETKLVWFKLNSNENLTNSRLEIYNINAAKLASQPIKSEIKVYLNNPGIYFYIIKSKDRILNRGKFVMN